MRSVLVMTVFVTMLVLVVAQVDDSSSITPAPSPSTFSLQQDVGSCDSLCELRCFLQRGIPQLYQFCMQLCKLTCSIGGGGGGGSQPIPIPPPPSLSSFAVHHCTSACVDSISTKLGTDEEKVKGDYVENCYNNCKKNY